MPPIRLSARWVVPMDRPPIEAGAVLIGDDGRIVATGSEDDVPSPPGVPAFRADGALLPGLVNTHTHLELTGFAPPDADVEFPEWIRSIRVRKERRSAAEFAEAARRGLADCFAQGVTTVADTGDSGGVIRALAEAGGSGIAYHEVFGPHPEQQAASIAKLSADVADLRRFETNRVRLGVSPHAPYSVSGELYRSVARFAEAERLPIAVHVAESAAESELLESGSGPFAAAWTKRGIPLPGAGCSPLAWLASHDALTPRTLCIHAVRVGAADLRTLRASGAAIAHCPRSNRAHRHGDAPLAALIAAGLRVGVGTDSVASVAPLDLLAEARLAARLASLSDAAALRLCTTEAADALGLSGEIGSLTSGKWGDVVVRDVPADTGAESLFAALLDSARPVHATFVAGRAVYRHATAAA